MLRVRRRRARWSGHRRHRARRARGLGVAPPRCVLRVGDRLRRWSGRLRVDARSRRAAPRVGHRRRSARASGRGRAGGSRGYATADCPGPRAADRRRRPDGARAGADSASRCTAPRRLVTPARTYTGAAPASRRGVHRDVRDRGRAARDLDVAAHAPGRQVVPRGRGPRWHCRPVHRRRSVGLRRATGLRD